MISALINDAGLSALVSLTARSVSRRMSPAATAVAFTVASVTIASTSTGILAVAAWYGVARLGPVAAAGGWSSRLLSNTTPLPLPVSVFAGIATLTIFVSVVHLWAHRAAELRSAQRLWYPNGQDPIVIADDDSVRATGSATVATAIATVALPRAERPPRRIALAIAESVTIRRIERLLHPTRTNNTGVVAGASSPSRSWSSVSAATKPNDSSRRCEPPSNA